MTDTLSKAQSTLAQITPEERAGLRDFHQLYERHYDEIQSALMASLKKIPSLQAVVDRTPKAQLDAQNLQGRQLMADAVLHDRWEPLLENQLAQGQFYAGMNIAFNDWFDLVAEFQRVLVPIILSELGESTRVARAFLGMTRYVDIAMSTIGEAYLSTKEKRILQQQHAIQELSTPVLQVKDRMLLLPIIGIVDTARARLLTQQLLQAVRSTRAKVVVMDITGVAAVDSKVANHLIQTVAAVRLMGARSVITGLSPEVAQTLVVLGVDLRDLHTVGDLQGGLEEAERYLATPGAVARREPGPGQGALP